MTEKVTVGWAVKDAAWPGKNMQWVVSCSNGFGYWWGDKYERALFGDKEGAEAFRKAILKLTTLEHSRIKVVRITRKSV